MEKSRRDRPSLVSCESLSTGTDSSVVAGKTEAVVGTGVVGTGAVGKPGPGAGTRVRHQRIPGEHRSKHQEHRGTMIWGPGIGQAGVQLGIGLQQKLIKKFSLWFSSWSNKLINNLVG